MRKIDPQCAGGTDTVIHIQQALPQEYEAMTYAKPSRKTTASPSFCRVGRRSLHTTNRGNRHAMKSWIVLIVITATRYATSSVQWYLWVRSQEVVKRNQ